MHLVEPEAVGPIEGDDALITPPRPPHRRVSVSLVFTLSVLIGTVVAIYLLLPARHDVLVTEAIEQHRDPDAWDIVAPSQSNLRFWSIGAIGKDVPLPTSASSIVGALRIVLLRRPAAVIRVEIGGDQVTYLVTHARGVAPEREERREGDLRAIAWRKGKWRIAAVGPDASADRWSAALR